MILIGQCSAQQTIYNKPSQLTNRSVNGNIKARPRGFVFHGDNCSFDGDRMMLGYSPWGNGHSTYPFDSLFKEQVDCFDKGFSGISAFLLWGGTDIHPSFYNQKAHAWSGAPFKPSVRDEWEWQALRYCKANQIPVIGVCRGAQLMCAFAGGKLIQDVTGHGASHTMTTKTGEVMTTTSSHHQMLDLHNVNHELLAWSSVRRSDHYYGEHNETPAHIDVATFKEPEVVYFPDFNGLAIQGHPEWADEDDRFVEYCLNTIQEYLFDEVWM
jgi:putative glutamine amidotransferase